MNESANNKIVKYRKPLNINIGMVIFATIFVYILICVVMYFKQNHIENFQVKVGSLSTNNIYTGIALRDEEVVSANQTGYINYFAREGERVGVGNLVYTLDESGRLSEYMNSNPDNKALSNRDLNELKTEILGFVNNFNTEFFSSVYDFKYNVNGTVLKLANSNILENIEKINASGVSDMISYCTSPDTGIVIYSTDGYEDLTLESCNSTFFDTKDYEKKQLIGNELVASGDPVYKIATNEDWSIVIEVNEEKEKELLEAEYVKVKFLKNQQTSWAEVGSYKSQEGQIFVELKFNNSMISFCTDRFIDVELIIEDEKGLKIPNSSIVDKEFFLIPKEYIIKGGNSNQDGVIRETFTEEGNPTTEFIQTTIYSETETEYYVDDMVLRIGDYIMKPDSTQKYPISKRGSLIGVYNINKGYADFKQINILYQNDEYSIVKSNTQYGLNVYDYIVLDAKSVEEDQLIYE